MNVVTGIGRAAVRGNAFPRVALQIAAAGFLLAILTPIILVAQAVDGRVLDEDTGEAITAAAVFLVDRTGEVVATGLTDSLGEFSLDAPAAGRYRLRGERIGYETATAPPFDLRSDEVLEVELRLAVDVVPLAPLTVVSDRPALVLDERLAGWDYYDRLSTYGKYGFGHFLDHDEIERRRRWSVSQLLQDMPGLRLRGAGGRRSVVVSRRGCAPLVYLDGFRIGTTADIDDWIPPSELVAVEVYTGIVRPGRFGGNPCGSILLWTGVAP